MKKQVIIRPTILFLSLLLMLLTACGGKKDGIKTTSAITYIGDTESKDPLRICVDIQDWGYLDAHRNLVQAQEAMEDFLVDLHTYLDGQEIVVEFLPNDSVTDEDATARRASAVSRLRVEILAGGGPDVFIMRYIQTDFGGAGANLDSGDILFTYPQKVMDSGLFLPLDEYMENNTRFAEWEKFPQAVMDAGRNYEGQQIIPLTYTFPVLTYPRETFDYAPDRLLTWNDMLTDPELAPFAADLINCRSDYEEDAHGHFGAAYPEYLEFTLGAIADYEKGELLFTEEELLQHTNEILALSPQDTNPDAKESMIGVAVRSYDQPVTLLPMYSDDGGISARIESYAAVNRNTKRPEEAFAVIDILLSTEAQQNGKIYTEYLCYASGLPMNEELDKIDTDQKMYLHEDNYKEICELQEQITSAYFDGEPTSILNMLFDCASFPDQTEGIVHEAYIDLQRRVRE